MPQDPNLAYDLSLFERKERPTITEVPLSPTVQKKQRRQRLAQSFLTIAGVLIVVVLLAGGILLRVTVNARTNELKDELADIQAQYTAMKSEQVRLEAELAAKTSAANVDEYILANEMVPLESRQIRYIVRSECDVVTTMTREPESWWQKAWNGICALFT